MLDINDASPILYEGFIKYLNEFFNNLNIKENFTKFIEARSEFLKYRNLIKLKNIVTEAQEYQTPLCTICMSDILSFAFVPCGHTFCKNCSIKQIHSCYICRNRISNKIKIYLS